MICLGLIYIHKHYIGDYAPKDAIKQEGIIQATFRIVDNHNPGRMYYTKLFGEVYHIQSVSTLMERDNVKLIIKAGDLELRKENNIWNRKVKRNRYLF